MDLSKLQDMVILLKNAQNLDQEKVEEICGNFAEIIEFYLTETAEDKKMEFENIILIIAGNEVNLAKLIVAKLTHICAESVDSEFIIKLIANLLSHDEFVKSSGEILENQLLANFEQVILLLGGFLQSDSTSVSQRAVKVIIQYISRLDQHAPAILAAASDPLVQILLKEVNESRDTNKTVYVRFVEVVVELALVSETMSQQIAKPVITQVFKDFFEMLDILTQVTIMDFVVKLTENEHGLKLMNESGFIQNLFDQFGGQKEDSFGFLSSNMLVVGAKLYSVDTEVFNVFENKNYMTMLREYMYGPDVGMSNCQDIGLSCLYFLFKQKEHSLVKYLIEDSKNHDLLNAYLRTSQSANNDHRKSFLAALEQLLDAPASGVSQRQSDIIQMIFSNIMSPSQFPQGFGQTQFSISFLIKIANTPFENEELLILNVLKRLLKHQWAFKPFFENSGAITYVLKRSKGKELAEAKYELNEWVVRESGQLEQVDMVVASQLQTYVDCGVYGLQGADEVPELATI